MKQSWASTVFSTLFSLVHSTRIVLTDRPDLVSASNYAKIIQGASVSSELPVAVSCDYEFSLHHLSMPEICSYSQRLCGK